jgi:hypothetical protein
MLCLVEVPNLVLYISNFSCKLIEFNSKLEFNQFLFNRERSLDQTDWIIKKKKKKKIIAFKVYLLTIVLNTV